MKSLADLKREMKVGSKWHCFNHLYGADMGIREVSRSNSVCVYFWTVRNDKRFECRLEWPKSDEVVFENDKVHIYENETTTTPRQLVLTYTKEEINNEVTN